MKKAVLSITVVILIFVFGVILLGKPTANPDNNSTEAAQYSESKNIEIRDGVQFITITAEGGYSPKLTKATANTPTKLIVKTDSTYDCSAVLAIKEIGFRKVLQPTGNEEIDLGVPEIGSLQGVCAMGMYNFYIDFE